MSPAEKRAARELNRARSEETKAGWANHRGDRHWIRDAQRALAATARGEDPPETTIDEDGYPDYSTAWDADWQAVIELRAASALRAAQLRGDLLAAPVDVGRVYDPAQLDDVDVTHPGPGALEWLDAGPEPAFVAMCAVEARR